ncbi:peptidyl-prolyl cis-trans isomerase [Emcibacter sp. SYSU 3D8]|uniref:peptidyl-prolyl cis-trans isomerase n=1 Tax=Emcibacter sp. SYSU 3D8 TaxID=3133969 RepID=UPI0031FEDD1E
MLTALRKGVNSWVLRGLLILIIASFVLWGVQSAHLAGPSTVASVDSVHVTQGEFMRAFEAERFVRTKDPSERYTTAQAVADGVDKLTLERLVMGAALDNAADDLGVRASDKRVYDAIHGAAQFHGPSGTFDRAIYREGLRQRNMTEAMYESEMRRLMERADLLGTLRSGVIVPEAVVQALYSYSSEVRWAHYVGIPVAAMTTIPEPSDQDIKTYYESHKQDYAQPEFRAFRFLVLNQADLASRTQVSEEQLKAEYEQRKSSLSTPEKRDLKQITVASEDAAKKLKQRLDAGEDFGDVARSAGMSAAETSLPATEKAALSYLGDDAANTAFSLSEGDVSEPVSSKLGWVIFKVDAVTPGREVSFDEARPQLMKDIVDNRVTAALDELSEKARTQIATGATIEALAKSLDLPLRTVKAMSRDGMDDQGVTVTGLPPTRAFVDSLFAKTEGEFIDLEDDGENGYFVTQIDKIVPAQVRPLDQIKEQVRSDWIRDARDQAARSVAEKMVEKVRGGTSLSDAATETGAIVASTPVVSRSDVGKLGGAFSRDLLVAMFDAGKGGVVFGPSARGDGYFVVQVAEVKSVPIDQNSDEYQQIRSSLGETLKLDIFAQYQTYLFDKYSVSRNQQLVDQVVSQMP